MIAAFVVIFFVWRALNDTQTQVAVLNNELGNTKQMREELSNLSKQLSDCAVNASEHDTSLSVQKSEIAALKDLRKTVDDLVNKVATADSDDSKILTQLNNDTADLERLKQESANASAAIATFRQLVEDTN